MLPLQERFQFAGQIEQPLIEQTSAALTKKIRGREQGFIDRGVVDRSGYTCHIVIRQGFRPEGCLFRPEPELHNFPQHPPEGYGQPNANLTNSFKTSYYHTVVLLPDWSFPHVVNGNLVLAPCNAKVVALHASYSGVVSFSKRLNSMSTCVPFGLHSSHEFSSPVITFIAPSLRSMAPSMLRPFRGDDLCLRCHRLRGQHTSTNFQPVMKSKRRKHRANSSEQPSGPGRPPRRVNLQSSTLSLREQLQIAKANTESSAPSKPVVRTKFRRKKEDVIRSGKRLQAEAQIPDGRYDIAKDPIIFIDAYNVIGAWPRLRKWRDRSDWETARRLLVDDVTEYSYVRGWECVVVFDAQGTTEDTKEEKTVERVTVIFTGNENADSYIERSVFELCESGRRQVWAATSDIAQLNFSQGKGAHVMTSNLFIQEIKRARRETREKLAEVDGNSMRANMLMSTVNEETRLRLYELRDRLEAS
ncbi:hypothetical protein FGB62_25g173 [Gracilaria domingensis]|nr:hypothetical protein FGB62_25g173 [Gracilaria domingensis]